MKREEIPTNTQFISIHMQSQNVSEHTIVNTAVHLIGFISRTQIEIQKSKYNLTFMV